MRMSQIDGLPVVDAVAPIVLTVTRRDVSKADKKRPDNCAVARACRREFHVKEVRVHLSRIYLKYAENWTRYCTPRPMRDEIISFDRGGSFVGGTFTLLNPQRSIRLGAGNAKKYRGKKYAATGRRKRGPYHVMTDVRSGPAYS